MQDLERAKKELRLRHCTCVACKGNEYFEAEQRGVAPLLQWLDDGKRLEGFSAADKVVGKGAAFLYILLGAGKLYAQVISKPALDLLTANHIYIEYGQLVDAIRNRTNTGNCPIEKAVWDIACPIEAEKVIRGKIKELAKEDGQ